MGQASASSSASSGQNNTGGNIYASQPTNWAEWLVIGVAVLLAGIWLIKRKK